MRFVTATKDSGSTCGELFFQLPDKYGADEANYKVSALCRKEVDEVYGGTEYAVSRLECELGLMEKTDTARSGDRDPLTS